MYVSDISVPFTQKPAGKDLIRPKCIYRMTEAEKNKTGQAEEVEEHWFIIDFH